MTVHIVKCWRPYFEHVADGRKTFDVRLNDRGYKGGDTLRLQEFVPEHEANKIGQRDAYYTGRECAKQIAYVLNPRPDRDPDCGLVAGYVVLGLRDG